MVTVRDRYAAAVKPVVRWGFEHVLPATAMRIGARRGDLQSRLFFAAGETEPWRTLDEIRQTGPLVHGRFGSVTASHAMVKEVLNSSDFRIGPPDLDLPGPLARLGSWAAETEVFRPLEPPSLLGTDGPDHLRYRKLVTRVFSVRAVEALRPQMEQIVSDLLDTLAGRPVIDLITAYANLLPVTVIAQILGVPLADRERVLELGAGGAPSLDLGLSWKRFRLVESSLAGANELLSTHIQRLRLQPGDDLLSQLVLAQDEGRRGLTDRELIATAALVLGAGFETTVNLLGSGTVLLSQHPDQLQAVRNDPSLWGNAVDEILRIEPPVLLTVRSAVRDVEVAGTFIPTGTSVITALAGANRDPDVFPDPSRFDVTRPNAKEHLSFSGGRHFCLGAALARMEGEVGLRMLFERYPDLRLTGEGTRRTTRILRGWEQLQVRPGAPSPGEPAARDHLAHT